MRTRDEVLADTMAEVAAALGWCVGVLDGTGKPGDVPTWVRNALHKATRPWAATDFEVRCEQRVGGGNGGAGRGGVTIVNHGRGPDGLNAPR